MTDCTEGASVSARLELLKSSYDPPEHDKKAVKARRNEEQWDTRRIAETSGLMQVRTSIT